MSTYFLLHDAEFFHRQARPALAACWRQRSFAPCRSLWAVLLPAAAAFAERYHTGAEEPLLARVESGLPFDRDVWRLLVGEVLLYAAKEIPEIETAPDTLACLLAPAIYNEGSHVSARFAPIQQAHYGVRDLVFGGGYYRPEHAGWNDVDDVARLADFLASVDPGQWTVQDLAPLRGMSGDEERADELEFAREWFPDLEALYRQASAQKQVVVCETITTAGLD
jgi:hypothetical protein